MIDIHTHILPCLDDGAQSLEEALRMAEFAASEGVYGMIATPHTRTSRYNSEPAQVREAVAVFNEALVSSRIPLTVYCGQEIRVNQPEDVLEDLNRGQLLTLHDSSYLLLELQPKFDVGAIQELIHELKLLELRPIIAHPERNPSIAANLELAAALESSGALLQINAPSVLGRNGFRSRRSAIQLCRRQLVHFIASDCHDHQVRMPGLTETYWILGKLFGSDQVDRWIWNARCVVENMPIERQQPLPGKRRWHGFNS
ncbi:tyrosine protein phosphatase [Paenibacillus sambharensis]|uniref:Tyrosine-protein phosphatase n=1 Tax=Paenibacillus sambharensis TaxID=1803190 RepID=A0A2W1LT83_9BACL|nr:CpsB/CapC family capsule biosynthesis tyrosine phosphatase [Paenibacillus sambharensis]PZD97724.1 tyrosine protein phosphatase [Paenibacillus sambharensis]